MPITVGVAKAQVARNLARGGFRSWFRLTECHARATGVRGE